MKPAPATPAATPMAATIQFTRHEIEMAQVNAIGAEDSTQITINLNKILETKLRLWQKLPAAAQPAATPLAWTPQVEVYRTELMRRLSNKLSMEEIADFSYWAAQPQRESEQP